MVQPPASDERTQPHVILYQLVMSDGRRRPSGDFLLKVGGAKVMSPSDHVNVISAGQEWRTVEVFSPLMFYGQMLRLGHAHMLWCSQKILIIFDPQSLKTVLSDSKVCMWKAVGGVRSDTTCLEETKGGIVPKWPTSCLVLITSPIDFFSYILTCYMCSKFHVCWSKNGLELI